MCGQWVAGRSSLLSTAWRAVLVLSVVALVSAAVAGCSEESEGNGGIDAGGDDVGPEGEPSLSVEPSTVSFNATPLGETNEQSFSVENVGEGRLEVTEVEFGEETDSAFAKGEDWPQDDVVLESGESQTITVVFAPEEAAEGYEGTVDLESNDQEAESPTQVSVQAPGNAPELYVSPSPLVFQEVSPGEEVTEVVKIANIGWAHLTIEEFSVEGDDDAFSLTFFDDYDGDEPPPIEDDYETPPDSLEAGKKAYMRVVFTPEEDTTKVVEATFDTNDPLHPEFGLEIVGNP